MSSTTESAGGAIPRMVAAGRCSTKRHLCNRCARQYPEGLMGRRKLVASVPGDDGFDCHLFWITSWQPHYKCPPHSGTSENVLRPGLPVASKCLPR